MSQLDLFADGNDYYHGSVCVKDLQLDEILAGGFKDMKWHVRYTELAEFISRWSSDTSTKVGAVIVDRNRNYILSEGYNDFPRGVYHTNNRRERPKKYEYTEHAERNAIYNARGVDLTGATLYMNYKPVCCSDCARGIIQSGVTEVIGAHRDFPGVGAGKHYFVDSSMEMFKEAGIRVGYLNQDHTKISWI